jgi:L-asparaginase II
MANPVLAEATRGPLMESRHRGAVAVLDADGSQVFAAGDIDAPVYPRSAVKAIQALPLVESGAADAFGFGNREIALAQSSHNGEPGHVETALSMLAKAGLSAADLECGPQWPSLRAAGNELVTAGLQPGPEHNNCSGKHAGFLCFAVHSGFDTKNYVEPDHPVQQAIRAAMEDLTGAAHSADQCGRDGCSIPTYAVPLKALAHGFARFGTGTGLSSERATAVRRIFAAATAEPWFIAGTGRFCTEAMQVLGDAALVKTGAEGVFCGTIPRLGLGIALKCDDGATRGAEAMMAEVLTRLLPESAEALATRRTVPTNNRRGTKVGEVRPVASAFEGLAPPAVCL